MCNSIQEANVKLDFAIATLSLLADNFEGGSEFDSLTIANAVYGIQAHLEQAKEALHHAEAFQTDAEEKLSRIEQARLKQTFKERLGGNNG